MTEGICEYDVFLRWLIGAFFAGLLTGGILGVMMTAREARRLIRKAHTDALADRAAALWEFCDPGVKRHRDAHLKNGEETKS